MNPADLIAEARELARPFTPSEDRRAGEVAAGIVSADEARASRELLPAR